MSDYGYPYLEQQLAAQPVQQQVFPQPQGPVSVDQAMPPPTIAPESYLSHLAALLHKDTQAPQQPTPQTSSGNPYSVNNEGNPYAIEGDSPLAALQNKFGGDTSDAPKT